METQVVHQDVEVSTNQQFTKDELLEIRPLLEQAVLDSERAGAIARMLIVESALDKVYKLLAREE